jgi:DNA polymerase/3'-5' exonuclease PolX
MGGNVRIPLAEAARMAEHIAVLLAPFCTRIVVAGSIRRRKPDVGDLELVAIPRLGEPPRDLFGEPTGGGADLLDEGCRALLGEGVFTARPDVNGHTAVGARYKRLLYRDTPLDLFVATAANWGQILAIRTGPGLFSKQLMSSRLMGGWLPVGVRSEGGQMWRGKAALETPEEADVFALVGAPALEPWRRTDTVRLLAGEWREPAR